MKLCTFFRSGTSHRMRIALNLKGVAVEHVALDLRTEAHRGAGYKALRIQQAAFLPCGLTAKTATPC